MTAPVRGDEGVLGHEIPAWLTVLPEKRRCYGIDLYFTEAWEELVAATGSPAALAGVLHDHAIVVCKPDAIAGRRLRAGLGWFARNGITVVAAEPCALGRHVTRALWQFQWNIATAERRDLTELLMAAGPGLLLVVRLPGDPVPATVRMAAMKGPVGTREPHHLRSAMGAVNSVVNSVHSTDEPADVVRELSVFLDGPARARAVAGMLDGRAVEVDALVEGLYASTPEESSFEFDVRFADRSDVRAATDWRAFAAAAAAGGGAWSDWDTVVLGTRLMTAHRPGLARVLPGVPPATWVAGAALF